MLGHQQPYKSCISLIFPSVICTSVRTHSVIGVPQVSVLSFVAPGILPSLPATSLATATLEL